MSRINPENPLISPDLSGFIVFKPLSNEFNYRNYKKTGFSAARSKPDFCGFLNRTFKKLTGVFEMKTKKFLKVTFRLTALALLCVAFTLSIIAKQWTGALIIAAGIAYWLSKFVS